MTNRRRLRLFLPLPVLAVAALVWPLSRPEAPERTASEVAYQSLPEKPEGEVGVGRSGVEPTAIGVAAWLKAVPAAKGADVPCDPNKLHVSWEEPPATAEHGAFIGPLGPAPTNETMAVNGVVQCEGSEAWAFMGFQARYVDDRWDVVAVPYVAEEQDLPEVTAPEPEDAPTGDAPSGPVTLDGRTFGAAIEGLAAYEPQRTCSGTAKTGTVAMRNLLLRDNPGSRNLGIIRGCGIGGTSEHKEGRAFDWGVNVGRPGEKAQADAFVAKLLATDQHGNRYALARRMGVMYVIWNKKIWSAYRAADGWRPYSGASAHTDHVHISLSWAGATAKTSFWSGNVVEVLLAASPTGTGGGSGSGRTEGAPAKRRTTLSTEQIAAIDAAKAKRREAWIADREARRKARAEAEAKQDAERQAEWEKKKAEWEARKAERAAQRAADELEEAEEKAARDLARAEAKAKYEADKAARDEAKRLAYEEAKAKYEADKAARAEAKRLAAEEAKAKYEADKAARDEAKRLAYEEAKAKYEADKAARAEAARLAAEKAAAEKAARDAARREAAEQARQRRRGGGTTTTTAPPATSTTQAPAPSSTTVPETTTTTEG